MTRNFIILQFVIFSVISFIDSFSRLLTILFLIVEMMSSSSMSRRFFFNFSIAFSMICRLAVRFFFDCSTSFSMTRSLAIWRTSIVFFLLLFLCLHTTSVFQRAFARSWEFAHDDCDEIIWRVIMQIMKCKDAVNDKWLKSESKM